MKPIKSVMLAALLLQTSFVLAEKPVETTNQLADSLQPFIDDHTVAGLVTLVSNSKEVIDITTLGMADIDKQKPMHSDSVCWIASMTKPITGACVMMMVDEGKLSLDDLVAKHLPSLAMLKTDDGQLANITVRQLLNHSSGMAELPTDEAYVDRTVEEVVRRYAKVKIQFKPGSRWMYSQTSINTASRIVEVLSGKNFDQFVAERICKPLGMRDTTFYPDAELANRIATTYESLPDGNFSAKTIKTFYGKPPTFHEHFPAGNSGLFSTAPDYLKFCQMLLNKGEYQGKRLLSEQAVAEMQTISTGDLVTGFTPGNGWGVACCAIREPQDVTAPLSVGSFGHGGAYGTQAWIDPKNDKIYILMVQRSNFPNSDASPLRAALLRAGSKL